MECAQNKCSNKTHKEIEAFSYCFDCKAYMCKNCDKFHSELCENHHSYICNKDLKNQFIGICLEKNHYMNLDYFCESHNELCCAACISKIRGKGNGQHFNCNICFIEEIKDKKEKDFKANLNFLIEFSKDINNLLKDLKDSLERNKINKDKLKLQITDIFTKIRNILNDREAQLLLEVDKKSNKFLLNKDFIKKADELPKKINNLLIEGKELEKGWNVYKLNKTIKKSIIFENNINIMKLEKGRLLKNISDQNKDIIFKIKNKKIDELMNEINIFGEIDLKTFKIIDAFKEMKINAKNVFIKKDCSNPNCKNTSNFNSNESDNEDEEEEDCEDYDDEDDYFKEGKYYECNSCCSNYCSKCIKKCKKCKENICLFCSIIKYDKFEDIELCPDCSRK